MSLPLKLLVDTNVWIDYFLERRPEAHEAAMGFMAEATAADAVLHTSSATMPDLFFLLCQETKRYLREHGKPVDELFAAAVRESAWSSVRNVMELSMIVPVGQNEALRAMTYRDLHDDFEDDLLLAAAARVDADYVVTSDRASTRPTCARSCACAPRRPTTRNKFEITWSLSPIERRPMPFIRRNAGGRYRHSRVRGV